MHKNGDRVLVMRDDYWYPGTIRHVDNQRFFVICDDGEDGFFEPLHLAALKLGVGDQVLVKLPITGRTPRSTSQAWLTSAAASAATASSTGR